MSKSTEITIREAAIKDAPALAALVRLEAECAQHTAAYYELKPDFDWIAFTKNKLGRGQRNVFLAYEDEELAGYIEVHVVTHPKPEKHRHRLFVLGRRRRPRNSSPLKPISWGVIEGCYVVQSYRRSGTGRLLVDEAMRWFNLKALERVELAVLAYNEPGRRFWEECGFKPFRLLLTK
ncbi:MAG: GNAT family N-acetyltransferase [Gammaproteobacteria bacterium]|nr:GNAT family N-acetyltransferase [Gammaproteobacteria bacterium]